MLSPRSRVARPTSSAASSSASTGAPLAAAAGTSDASAGSRNVLIHVFDEYRKSAKDFVCRRDVLLANMKYFRKFLNLSNEHDEIDISVHCDVEVFEWLVAYMQQTPHASSPLESTSDAASERTLASPSSPSPPHLSLDNIASILVSSEFLQMETLVDECVRFIAARMQAFLQLRVDLGCLSDATVAKIAERCSAEQLQALHDPKDKILSKLHKKKLEAFVRRLRESEKRVERCANCGAVYLQSSEAVLTCPAGRRQIGVHGELVARHEARPGWRLDELVRELTGGTDKNVAGVSTNASAVSCSAVYWYLWASTNCFLCSTCKRVFAFLELRTCALHSGPVGGVGADAKFSCCGAHVFDVDDLGSARVRGCSMKEHVPVFAGSAAGVNDKHRGGDVNSDVDTDDATTETHFEAVCKLPGLWDVIRSCEIVVRSAAASEATRTGMVSPPATTTPQQISILHALLHGELASGASSSHPRQLQASVLASTKRPTPATPSTSTTAPALTSSNSGGDTTSPQRQRQYRALQLQEKDRLRHQLLARRLVQMRKNLTA